MTPEEVEKYIELERDGYRKRIAELEEQLAELSGEGAEPSFGLNPADSAALLKLRRCIDDQAGFLDEETEQAGDYEAAVRHMGQIVRGRACLFSAVAQVDVTNSYIMDELGNMGLSKRIDEFFNYRCRLTIEALYPILGKK